MDDPHIPNVREHAATDRIETFIKDHTEVIDHVPLLEECPICLENYSTEPCVRIIGINGCGHHFGSTCLRALLQSRPNQEKKCPLCRTIWITGRARNTTRRGESGGRIYLPSLSHSMGRFRAVRSGEVPHGQPQVVQQRRRNNSMRAPVFLDSDVEDVDYETQRENFEEFSRDTESVRSRAGRTASQGNHQHQGSCPAQNNSDSGNVNAMATVSRFDSSRPHMIDDAPRNLDFYGNGLVLLESIASRQVNPATSQAQNSNRSGHQRRSSSLEANPDTMRSWSVLDGSDSASPPPASPADVDMSEITETYSSSTQSNLNAIRTRHFKIREEVLKHRESQLSDREALLAQREQHLTDIRDLIKVQQDELEDLVKRQKRRLERIMRCGLA